MYGLGWIMGVGSIKAEKETRMLLPGTWGFEWIGSQQFLHDNRGQRRQLIIALPFDIILIFFVKSIYSG
jgi:hypothetical protein